MEALSIKASFHCRLSICSPMPCLVRNKYTVSTATPETTNLIPKASIGGIASITSLIARKLEPQRADSVTILIIIFHRVVNNLLLDYSDDYIFLWNLAIIFDSN